MCFVHACWALVLNSRQLFIVAERNLSSFRRNVYSALWNNLRPSLHQMNVNVIRNNPYIDNLYTMECRNVVWLICYINFACIFNWFHYPLKHVCNFVRLYMQSSENPTEPSKTKTKQSHVNYLERQKKKYIESTISRYVKIKCYFLSLFRLEIKIIRMAATKKVCELNPLRYSFSVSISFCFFSGHFEWKKCPAQSKARKMSAFYAHSCVHGCVCVFVITEFFFYSLFKIYMTVTQQPQTKRVKIGGFAMCNNQYFMSFYFRSHTMCAAAFKSNLFGCCRAYMSANKVLVIKCVALHIS